MKKYIAILFIILIQFGYAATSAPDNGLVYYGYTKENPKKTEKVIVTPNPALDNTMIKLVDKDAQITEISIYSLLGNQIFQKNYSGKDSSIALNVQPFKKGKYLIKVGFKDGSSEVKSLIKQ